MIISNDFLIKVIRKKESYDFIVDKNHIYEGNRREKKFTRADFRNNIKNNMLDDIILYKNQRIYNDNYAHTEIFRCKAQTVANYPLCDLHDTIAVGKFQLKCFIDPLNWHGEPHIIINAKDIEGQIINSDSRQWEDNQLKGRWGMHDTWYKGKRLIYAWSKACFVVYPEDLVGFNDKLRRNGIDNNYILNGEVTEI